MNLIDLFENISAQQRRVGQLPADFRPPQTSPQLSGPYPGRNATQGYLVGEGEERVDTLVTKGLGLMRGPTWLDAVAAIKYQVGERDYRERKQFYDFFVQQLVNRYGKKGVAEGKSNYNFDIEDLKRLERIRDLPTLKAQALALISKPSTKPMKPEKVEWFKNALENMNSPIKVIKLMYDLMLSGEGHAVVGSTASMNPNSYRRTFGEQGVAESVADNNPMAAAVVRRILRGRLDLLQKYGAEAVLQAVEDVTDGDTEWEEIGSSDVSAYVQYVEQQLRDRMGSREEMNEAATTTEDVLSAMKKKLNDYLQNVADAIKTDPTLKDKLPKDLDQLKAVKTIRTDDGHKIKINGNEDDGFRISIRNREMSTPFKSLDEAVMASEMYCARRRTQALEADYMEEN